MDRKHILGKYNEKKLGDNQYDYKNRLSFHA